MTDEILRVGSTREDQARNASLLDGYDYSKYEESLTGYTEQDLQRIAFVRWESAVRTPVGPRGNYKAGMALLPDGKVVLSVCRKDQQYPPVRICYLHMYESADYGLTWQEIASTTYQGESSLTALADGSLVLTAGCAVPSQSGGTESRWCAARSEDGGRTWETTFVPFNDNPRRIIREPHDSLLLIGSKQPDYYNKGGGSSNLLLGRSRDGGRSWELSEGLVDWDYTNFGEVSGDSRQRRAAARRASTADTGHDPRRIRGHAHHGISR